MSRIASLSAKKHRGTGQLFFLKVLATPCAPGLEAEGIRALLVVPMIHTARSRRHDLGVFQIEFQIPRSEALCSQPATDPGTFIIIFPRDRLLVD
jgi:hypothetical protein